MSNAAEKLSWSKDSTGEKTTALISPRMDLFLIGGGSVMLLVLMSFMLNTGSPDGKLSWFIYSLSFVMNFPHFLSSYQLLYADHGTKIFKEPKFFWAAVVAPAIIVITLAAGLLSGNPQIWGYMASSMYFFVGWHYAKQIFGGITVSNARQKFFYNAVERNVLKANLFSLWAISFLGSNIGDRSYTQDGISYSSFNLPAWTMPVAYWCLSVSALALIYVNIKKYIREGRVPSAAAIVCLLTFYAWYLPAVSHPMFMLTIPFFHSMQYMLFVWAFRRNKVDAMVKEPNTPAGREQRLFELYGYLLIPFLTGAIFMYYLPRYIDSLQLHNAQLFGPTAFFFAFTIFINIHHYFIDNVIWRGNNQEVKKYLMS